jgi:4-amino-4-deoxy-L-arabinose transferase-like glycosyltransferase
LAVVLLVSCLLRAAIADIPLERDEGEYGYIAQRWLAGELPYRDSFNQKFPGPFLIYAIISCCLGESPAAIHWGLQLWSMGTITLVFLLGWRLFSAPAGIAAAALAALMMGDHTVKGNAANTELFAILFFSASVLAAVRAVERGSVAWSLGAGILGAAGMMCKQPGLFNLAFVVLYVAWGSRRRVRQVAATAAGAAAVIGLLFFYFAVHGAWQDFYDNTIGYNLSYGAHLPLEDYPAAFWVSFVPILESFWLVGLLALWGALEPAVRRRPGPGSNEPGLPNPDLTAHRVLVVVWLLFCFLAVSVGGYFREHYFIQIIPAVALLAGLGATRVPLPQVSARSRTAFAYVLCGVLACYLVSLAPWYYLVGSAEEKCRKLYKLNPFAESLDIGRFIAENSTPEDSVLVMGSEPQILYYARRRSATRYILAYPLMTPFPDTEARQKSAMEEVRRNNPKFVVTVFMVTSFLPSLQTPPTIFQDLRDYMAGRYAAVGAVVLASEPRGPPPKLPFVTGDAVTDAYRANPIWYDRPKLWAIVLVWRRLGAPAAPAGPGANEALPRLP